MASYLAYLHVFNMAAKIHTESYFFVDSLFNVPRNLCGGSVLVFLFYFVFFLFLLTP